MPYSVTASQVRMPKACLWENLPLAILSPPKADEEPAGVVRYFGRRRLFVPHRNSILEPTLSLRCKESISSFA